MAAVAPLQSPTTIKAEDALRVARADAESAYRDLNPYKILIALESDGWHVDFQPKSSAMNAGGPRYLIDAETGHIITKRYEQ